MRKLTDEQQIFIHSAIEEYLEVIAHRHGEDSDLYKERDEALTPLLDEIMENDLFIGKNPAALLGAAGGTAKTDAKVTAARANGAKGGRPKGSKNKVKDSG